jgi:cyclopropane fatty-acyl-phospholipid synthase-like methyltransferase
MPGSLDEGKDLSLEWVRKINPERILDIGAGWGTYARLIRNNGIDVIIDGIEVWQPYVAKYQLNLWYNKLYNVDARNWEDFDYDLVIMGDVLEHMTKEEAVAIWDKVSKNAKAAIISIPIIHYPQGEYEGNPYEEHVKDDWTTDEVLNTFDNITEFMEYESVGVFLAEFN